MIKKPNPKQKLNCTVSGGVLRIEIGISALKWAAERHEGFWQPQTDKHALIVKNERVFAKDVARELMREGEDGSTPVHLLLDKAIEGAVNDGSEGCDHDAMDAITDAEFDATRS